MNNNLYKKIWKEIELSETITIFTHINPDGDTIGTSLALKGLININYPNIIVKISGDIYPYNLNFLESNDEVSNEFIENSLAILVDSSSIARTFDKRILLSEKIIKIDHHHPEGNEWFLVVDGDNYPATGEVIYEMIKELDLNFDYNIAKNIFVSIWTDTSGLVERNPTKLTHEAIEWTYENGVDKNTMIINMELNDEDSNKVMELISDSKIENNIVYKVNDEIVSNDVYRPATEKFFKKFNKEVYIFSTKINNNQYRVGLRSKKYDVSKVAEKFGGGGHVTSSGTIADNKDIVFKIIEYIKGDLNESNKADCQSDKEF